MSSRHVTSVVLALAAGLALAGCAKKSDRILFDGVHYKTKAKSASDDRMDFVVTVPGVDRGLPGAQKAGQHEAVRYCISNFGASDIVWQGGGETAAPEVAGTTMTLRGRCALW